MEEDTDRQLETGVKIRWPLALNPHSTPPRKKTTLLVKNILTDDGKLQLTLKNGSRADR